MGIPGKAELKKVRSLHYKKYRQKHGLFIAEGPHLVEALLRSKHPLARLYATPRGYEQLTIPVSEDRLTWLDEDTLTYLSGLESQRGLIATAPLPDSDVSDFTAKGYWLLGIDGIQDPGNLGTIIRTADWFGFQKVVCSPQTVDAYNPKVVQATMGSIFHVRLLYTDLPDLAANITNPVYGLATSGANLYKTNLPEAGMLVVGHETKGMTETLQNQVTERLRIPGFGQAESLNAAIATAVTLSHLRARLSGFI